MRFVQPTVLQMCCGYLLERNCHCVPVQVPAYTGAVSTPQTDATGSILRLVLFLLPLLTTNEKSITSLASILLKSSWLRASDWVKNEWASRAFTSTTARIKVNTLIFQSFVLTLSSNDIGECLALLWSST